MRKIIVTEDDLSIAEVIQIILSGKGFTVVTYNSIESFSKDNDKASACLFLFDNFLPDGKGIRLCSLLKSNTDLAHIPIVIMSAQKLDIGTGTDPDAFISKPFDIQQFREVVDRYALRNDNF